MTERLQAWPIEDWAAEAGRVFRKARRRVARRKARVAIGVVFAVVVAAVGGNALWSQAGSHPAPLWGDADPQRVALAAHGAPPVRRAGAGAAEVEVGSSDMVAELQDGLKASGYYDGPANGELDVDTVDAIRAFEREAGLPESGEPSVTLLAAVTAAETVDMPGNLDTPEAQTVEQEPVALPSGAGSSGAGSSVAVPASVAEIQKLLNDRGFGPLDVDGQMGKRTRLALDAFAAQAGLSARDGLSPEVLRALASGG